MFFLEGLNVACFPKCGLSCFGGSVCLLIACCTLLGNTLAVLQRSEYFFSQGFFLRLFA